MIKTAEFVSPKHPDKLCDRISDKLLDTYLVGDSNSRCAIEVAGGHNQIFVTGEVTSKVNLSDETIQRIVFDITGIDNVVVHINEQSPEISRGVDSGGAGDQGIMIGYACNENEEMVPQEYYFARKLNKYIYNEYPYDGKTQVTIYDDKRVIVVTSFQNSTKNELEKLVLKFFEGYPDYEITSLHCNPAGDWSIGGLQADSGMTGRKIVVDAYGPRVPVGGGAFSGKDATKVDRSAAYMARKVAVDLLKLYGGNEVLVKLSYAIGYPQPIQATASINGMVDILVDQYDLSPQGMITELDLKNPIFYETSMWGHMGNGFKWG